MASMAKTIGAMPIDDPFVSQQSSDNPRHRYSGFDSQTFSLSANGSSSQIKRALEAHLAETDRRLQDTQEVGTVLVKQRQELAERLQEVSSTDNEDDIPSELRRKVAELEREVAETSRETARIFVSKQRVPSGENSDAANTSVLSSQAQHSPSKIHAPTSRKTRNQPPTRLNDVKLATALTDTLLGQLRDLQAAYAEREDALKSATHENSELELDLDKLRQRLKALDESEQRFRDENWSLETQVSDLSTAQKEASEREQRLNLNINATKVQKAALERELDELKQTHGKLSEDHSTIRKQHDAELSTLRRNATTNEVELSTLRKKVDDLTSQNKELAKAFTARFRQGDYAGDQDLPYIPGNDDDDQVTPEPSPPPSPSKATPRHGALESETLKSSLHHAQRMIQHLKNNIHREKTEKFELKKLLQEARDELESKRKGSDSANKKRNSKQTELAKKQSRPDRLGAARSSTDEIIMDDPEWEDHDEVDTPSKPSRVQVINDEAESGIGRPGLVPTRSYNGQSTDAYVTATEHSDAFETANEQNTETEAFQTGVESLDGNDSDELTETERSTTGNQVRRKPSALKRFSYESTASTSDDEDLDYSLNTPTQAQHPRYKVRVNRGGNRQSTSPRSAEGNFMNEDANTYQESPGSLASASGTPVQSKSLFAELGDLSDGETEASGTPQSVGAGSTRFSTPEVVRKTPLPSRLRSVQSIVERHPMVDAGTMTDDLPTKQTPSSPTLAAGAGLALGGLVGAGIGHELSTKDEGVSNSVIHLPLPSESNMSQTTEAPDISPAYVQFAPSAIASQGTEPGAAEPSPAVVLPVSEPVLLQISGVFSQHTEPLIWSVPLSRATIMSQQSEPVSVEKVNEPLVLARITSLHTEPVKQEAPTPVPVMVAPTAVHERSEPTKESISAVESSLDFSSLLSQHTEPRHAKKPADTIGLSSGLHEGYASSTIVSQSTEPIAQALKSRDATEIPEAPSTPGKSKFDRFGAVFRRTRADKSGPIVVAEDETSGPQQAPKDVAPQSSSRGESRVPFQSVNGNAQASRSYSEKSTSTTSRPVPFSSMNESTQTMLSSREIEALFKASASREAPVSPSTATFASNTSPRKTREPTRRPGSAGSNRSGMSPPPPLPQDAKQHIAAQRASLQSTSSVQAPASGAMGPPTMPASAYRRPSQTNRPTTPVGGRTSVKPAASAGVARSGMSSPVTRRSSITSFVSDMDQRFGGNNSEYQITNPQMLRAVTETMLGEWMWKYTSGSGVDGASTTRHQRFFWVHPYTLTLYWSTEKADETHRKKSKASAVRIKSVRVVPDDNPNPPGLYHKSIVIEAPHRTIKMTAPTEQRHLTWFNALSYLLMRQSGDEIDDEDDIRPEDIADFDPNARSSSRATGRSRFSQMSYTSRTTTASRQYPTLRPSAYEGSQQRSSSAQPHSSISSRITSIFHTPQAARGTASSRQSQVSVRGDDRSSIAGSTSRRESVEDSQKAMDAQRREASRMENVRACCDGKHDVGSLPRSSRRDSRLKRASFQPSSGSIASTVHRRNHSETRSVSKKQQLEMMDPANIASS